MYEYIKILLITEIEKYLEIEFFYKYLEIDVC